MTNTVLSVALVYCPPLLAGVAALGLAVFYTRAVLATSQGNERMVEIAAAIREGAMAFIRREYTWVSVFVAAMAVLIFVFLEWGRPWGAIAYVGRSRALRGAGFVGMRIATAANARTTEAARTGGIPPLSPSPSAAGR
jgi:K(+)-stimulated pyrophosphate-energized sodium pump